MGFGRCSVCYMKEIRPPVTLSSEADQAVYLSSLVILGICQLCGIKKAKNNSRPIPAAIFYRISYWVAPHLLQV